MSTEPPVAADLHAIADIAKRALGADRAYLLAADRLPPAAAAEDGPMVWAPIRVDGEPVAGLVVTRDKGRPSFRDQAGQMEAICDLAALVTAASGRAADSAQRLGLAQAVAAAVVNAATIEGAFVMTAETVFERTAFTSVTATVVLHESAQQMIVADLTRDGPSAVGLRRRIGEGLMGAALCQRQLIHVGNAGADPRYSWPEEDVYESMLIAPVVVDDRCEGAIELAALERDRFSAEDAVLMRTVADQLATALRGVRLRDESGRRADRLDLAAGVARAVARVGSVEDALRAAVQTVFEHTRYSSVTAVLAERESDQQVVVLDLARAGPAATGMRRPLAIGATGRALESGRQVVIGRVSEEGGYAPWNEPMPHQSVLITPVVDGIPVATLNLYELRADQFDHDDRVLMQTVAEQVAAALRGVRLREQSDRRADRLALALEVARAVTGAGSVEEALRAAVATIDSAVGCGSVAAFVPLPESAAQVALVDIDHHDISIEGLQRPLSEGLSGRVFTSGQQLLVASTSAEPGRIWDDTGQPTYESALLTPVAVGDHTAAVIALYAPPQNAFHDEDAVVMQTVCEHLGLALRVLDMRDHAEQRAQRLGALEQRHRLLLERLVRAQEQERSRVAADLHDDTIQVMAACVFALDSVRHAVEIGETDRAAAGLGHVSSLVSGAVERARRMTFELRPAVLWHHGLTSALEQSLEALQREAGLTSDLTVDGMAERIDPLLETIVFRSIGEVLANVRAHAGASSVDVHVKRLGEELVAEVRDDGRGFDLEPALARARRTNHLGLEAMMERIRAAGGDVCIDTAPGAGTTVRISVPLAA